MTRPNLNETRKALLAVRERQQRDARGRPDTIARAPRVGYLPLSAGQQRLWFLDQLAPGQPNYNSPFALRLRTTLDAPALQRALTAVVARHEVLRTRYPSERGVPYQVVEAAPELLPLPVTDLGPDATGEQIAEFAGRVARQGFDLASGPVLRAALGRISGTEHVLVVVVHHIASDGWSSDILIRELLACYLAYRAGQQPALPELDVQFADYAVWQRDHQLTGDVLAEQLAYWRGHLSDLPDLNFPTDRPRPAVRTGAGAATDRLLPDSLRRELLALARSERVTLLTVTLAAFTALLARYSGQDDIPVGSVFSGRTRPEIEPLIGFFANTLVLRTSTAGDPTVRELLVRTSTTVLGAHFHQDLPFGALVDDLRPERDPSRNPLFQVSFTLQNAGAESAEVADVRAEQVGLDLGTARFDLAVQLGEVPGQGLRLWAEYSTELFDGVRIERLLDCYERLVAAMVADPGARLSALPMLPPADLRALVERNGTDRVWDTPPLLHEMVRGWAERTPDAPALRYAGETVTYRELAARADRLAARLRAAGVGPESVVGLLLERSPELPAAMLGILGAGGAYLPLDPDSPAARWELVLGEGGATVVVTTKAYADQLPASVTAVLVDGDDAGAGAVPGAAPAVRPDNLAYVIFTSGSTGKPKGVQVEHRSIANFTADIIERFRLGPGDRVLQFANPAFDVSLFDFFSALGSGATLVQAPRSTLLNPYQLAELMGTEGVTVTDLPPAVLGLLDPAGLPALRTLFVGLEAFPGELVNRWNTPGREFHNGYGPTEATVACIDYRCPHQVWDSMPPIGTPMTNYQAYVLDPAGALVPDGVPGELHVGGVGVARGYAGQPAATAARFVPDPFRPGGGRLYRTGDLVRWRYDGQLEFLGRVDSQVKIRGLRVEPAEIETALVDHPGVAEAVVVARPTPAGKALVAYLVGPAVPAGPELRSFLAARLPTYLVPTLFVPLPALPRAASGKLDRSRLPDPRAGVPDAAPVPTPPATATERTLAGIWTELLGADSVGVHDSFFDLGANSLHATQLVARIRDAFGITVDLRELFTDPTVAGLAALVDARELATASEDELAALLGDLEAGSGGGS